MGTSMALTRTEQIIAQAVAGSSVMLPSDDASDTTRICEKLVDILKASDVKSFILPFMPVKSLFDFLKCNQSLVPIIMVQKDDVITTAHNAIFMSLVNGSRELHYSARDGRASFALVNNAIFVYEQTMHSAISNRCTQIRLAKPAEKVQPNDLVGVPFLHK